MKVELKPGQEVSVEFHETDGRIRVKYGQKALLVFADLPDDEGREGVIYRELFDSKFRVTDEVIIKNPGRRFHAEESDCRGVIIRIRFNMDDEDVFGDDYHYLVELPDGVRVWCEEMELKPEVEKQEVAVVAEQIIDAEDEEWE